MTPSRLVVVACHAVFVDGRLAGGYPDEAPYYLEHAQAGVRLAAPADTVLLFSGGATQASAGLRTEAGSYVEQAGLHGWWGYPEVAARAYTEDYARDSWENILFSLHRFHTLTGRWPEQVTAAGWKFKERRFHLHWASLGWPANRFRYEGVNNPPLTGLAAALAGEEEMIRAAMADPQMEGSASAAKRARRDPFHRGHPYPIGALPPPP